MSSWPQADILWDGSAILTDETGVHDLGPRTEEDWQRLRNAAVILAETQNLLVMEGRKVAPEGETLEGYGTLNAAEIQTSIHRHRADFVANAGAMQKLALQAIANIDARDLDGLNATGGANRSGLPILPSAVLVSARSDRSRRRGNRISLSGPFGFRVSASA